MRFSVERPDPTLRHHIEEGPQFMCWRGDEDCAFYRHGPCTAIACTCESYGYCPSCPPRGPQPIRRVP